MKTHYRLLYILLLLLSVVVKLDAQSPLMEIKEGEKYTIDKGVQLQRLRIDVKIVGGIATTIMKMTFFNHTNRLMEGRLSFPLPDGVSVSGFALDVNGNMRQAVPVAKEKATAVFESIERRRVDPGLLEKTEGNNFRTRIYPLPINGARTIEITYNQELAKTGNQLFYYLPLTKELIKDFSLSVSVFQNANMPTLAEKPDGSFGFQKNGNVWSAAIHKRDFIPSNSLKIQLPFEDNISQTLIKKDNGNNYYFISNIHVALPAIKQTPVNNIAIIWDNSLSGMKRNHEKEKEFLEAYFSVNPNLSVTLITLSTSLKTIGTFKIKNNNRDLFKAIDNIIYDGATDYCLLNPGIIKAQVGLFFTDGLSNFGSLNELPGLPIHSIASNPVADFNQLKYISDATGGRFINLNQLNVKEAAELSTKPQYRFIQAKPAVGINEVYAQNIEAASGNFMVTGITSTLSQNIVLQFGYGNKIDQEITVYLAKADETQDWAIEKFWAQQKITALELFFEENKNAIAMLGKQFGIITKNTSLIVLEDVHDYIKYGITPPPDLSEAYNAIIKERRTEQEEAWYSLLEQAKTSITSLKQWWNTPYPVKVKKKVVEFDMLQGNSVKAIEPLPISPTPETKGIASAPVNMELKDHITDVQISDATLNEITSNSIPRGKIITVDIKSDAAYMKDLNMINNTNIAYEKYLQLRTRYETTPSFYFDVANWFFAKNETATAVQILSNLVELELEDAGLYKMVAYELKKYGLYEKELLITKKILDWRPMDPQSYRDYALALQDNLQYQNALDTLYTALTQTYTEEILNRDQGIEEVLLVEINNLISTHRKELDISKINKALIFNLPVDIRVVLNWNMDNTDIDLHVIDPQKEECSYQNQSTTIGGRISNDFTDGFGPEQFLLKKAIKGKYEIKTNFFGDRSVIAAGPSTLMAEVFIRYATGTAERKLVVFQADKEKKPDADGKTLIATFEF